MVETTIDRAEESISSGLTPSLQLLGDAFTETASSIREVEDELKGLELPASSEASLEGFLDIVTSLPSEIKKVSDCLAEVTLPNDGSIEEFKAGLDAVSTGAVEAADSVKTVQSSGEELRSVLDNLAFPSEIGESTRLLGVNVYAATTGVDTLNRSLVTTGERIRSIVPDLKTVTNTSDSTPAQPDTSGRITGIGKESLGNLAIPELSLTIDTTPVESLQESLDNLTIPDLSITVDRETLDTLLEDSSKEISLTFIPEGIEEIEAAIEGLRTPEEILIPVEQAGSTWTIQEQIDALHGKTVTIPVEAQVDKTVESMTKGAAAVTPAENTAQVIGNVVGNTSSFNQSFEKAKDQAKDFSASLNKSLSSVKDTADKGLAPSLGSTLGLIKSLEVQVGAAGVSIKENLGEEGLNIGKDESLNKMTKYIDTVKEFTSSISTSSEGATGLLSNVTNKVKGTSEAVGNFSTTLSTLAGSAGLDRVSGGLSKMTTWLGTATTSLLEFAAPVGLIVGVSAAVVGAMVWVGKNINDWIVGAAKLEEQLKSTGKAWDTFIAKLSKEQDVKLALISVVEDPEQRQAELDTYISELNSTLEEQEGKLGEIKAKMKKLKLGGGMSGNIASEQDIKQAEFNKEQIQKQIDNTKAAIDKAEEEAGNTILKTLMIRVPKLYWGEQVKELQIGMTVSEKAVESLSLQFNRLTDAEKGSADGAKLATQIQQIQTKALNVEVKSAIYKVKEALDEIGMTKPELAVRELNKELAHLDPNSAKANKLKSDIQGLMNLEVSKELKGLGHKTNIEIATTGLPEVIQKTYEYKRAIDSLADTSEAREKLYKLYEDMTLITSLGIEKLLSGAVKASATAGMTEVQKKLYESNRNLDVVMTLPITKVDPKQLEEAENTVKDFHAKIQAAILGEGKMDSLPEDIQALLDKTAGTDVGDRINKSLGPVLNERKKLIEAGFSEEEATERTMGKMAKGVIGLEGELGKLGVAVKKTAGDIQELLEKRAATAFAEIGSKLEIQSFKLDVEVDTIGMNEAEKATYNYRRELESVKALLSPEQYNLLAEGIAQVKNEMDRFEGAKLTEKFMLPEEKFTREKGRLDSLLKNGQINMRTYSAAVAEAGKSLDKTQQSIGNLTNAIAGSGAGIKQVTDYTNELEHANIKAASAMLDTSFAPGAAAGGGVQLPAVNPPKGEGVKDVVLTLQKIEELIKQQLKKEPIKVNVQTTDFTGV